MFVIFKTTLIHFKVLFNHILSFQALANDVNVVAKIQSDGSSEGQNAIDSSVIQIFNCLWLGEKTTNLQNLSAKIAE